MMRTSRFWYRTRKDKGYARTLISLEEKVGWSTQCLCDLCGERFDINNLVCLCKICHKDFHRLYGTKRNTAEQFQEFLSKKSRH
jgi:hypothetical protein